MTDNKMEHQGWKNDLNQNSKTFPAFENQMLPTIATAVTRHFFVRVYLHQPQPQHMACEWHSQKWQQLGGLIRATESCIADKY